MCGRYTLRQTTEDLLTRFGIQLVLFQTAPRYNIAPSQTVPVIRGNGQRRLEGLKWGLVPFW
ncbi:MAG TPA: SOS response-associated peptidase family protein, partial [Candidatus Obscuribacterales bacterium]